MAARCEVNNAHHFVSSNAYYGYVPAAPTNNEIKSNDNCMDVDVDDCPTAQQLKNKFDDFNGQKQMIIVDRSCSKTKKRAFGKDEQFTNYMPRFKKFKEDIQCDENNQEYQITVQASINKSSEFGFRDSSSGNWFSFSNDEHHTEHYQHGPTASQVYRSTQLHLIPPDNFDSAYQPIKLLDLKNHSKTNSNDELEDMLLLTHGSLSYHFKEEAEF